MGWCGGGFLARLTGLVAVAVFFFFSVSETTGIYTIAYTLSLQAALPIAQMATPTQKRGIGCHSEFWVGKEEGSATGPVLGQQPPLQIFCSLSPWISVACPRDFPDAAVTGTSDPTAEPPHMPSGMFH